MANTINNKAKRDSRERMIKALFGLVQTQKVQDVSISELCGLAQVNRTTFYNHYNNIGELAQDARNYIMQEYVKLFEGNTDGFTPSNLLIMFQHIYHNQLVYNTYFKLNPNYDELLNFYDQKLARRCFPGQSETMIRYHAEFFAAGIVAIIQSWLKNGCRETPEAMVGVILSEYQGRDRANNCLG